MKTTLDLPEELSATVRSRIKLPLIECSHEARPGEEMTPERVADVLLEEEAKAGRGASSGSDLRALPEKLRSEVGAILPSKSVAGDLEVLELLQISERAEHRPIQLITQIDLARGAVAEAQPYGVTVSISSFQNMKAHGLLQRTDGLERKLFPGEPPVFRKLVFV